MEWVYFFYEDILLTKYKGENLSEHIEKCGNACILEGCKVNHKFPKQIEAYHKFLKDIKQRKVDKAGIYQKNHLLIMGCLASLVKLNQLREDEAYIILKVKKKKRVSRKYSVIAGKET
tara:strand:- start:458 stop:811 length:354 start_codon:yes stop_codon:yes gene_type:complete